MINNTPSDLSLFFEDMLIGKSRYLSKAEKDKLNQEYPYTMRSFMQYEAEDENDELLFVENSEYSEEEDDYIVEKNEPCCDKNCLRALTEQEITERWRSFDKMSKREQDASILSQLVICKINGTKPPGYERQRTRFKYRFDNDRPLCRNAFMSVYGISLRRLQRLQKLVVLNVLVPPPHGNARRIPKHAVNDEDADLFRNFLDNYAEVHGLPDPGRLRRDTREILLPSSDSFVSVWRKYKEGLESLSQSGEQELRVLGYHAFLNLWKQMMPHVKFSSPRTDLCDRCEEIKTNIKYAASSSQTAKWVDEYNRHCAKAQQARELYREQVNETRECWEQLSKKKRNHILDSLSTVTSPDPQPPCSRDITMHYSFDFAQQVHYPFSSRQRTQEFFKTARKCQVFGVCAEALPCQVFFLIDESEFFGKGSKMVISLLDAFFHLHGLGEKKVLLHADNCTGQNKNNYMIWYLLWRVMNGLHERISLSFMLPGHTKFAPDAYFGLFKLKYRHSTIDCLHDLTNCVRESSQKGYTIPQVYGKHYGLPGKAFEFRDWDAFLGQYFHKIEGILDYNYFDFDSKQPGWVKLRVNPDDAPQELLLLKKRFFRFPSPVKYPESSCPQGLSHERQEYLYKEIRPFIRDKSKRDIACPKLHNPVVPKKSRRRQR